MFSEDTIEDCPKGHIEIEKMVGIPADEMEFLKNKKFTHAMWVDEKEGGTLEVSKLCSVGCNLPKWQIFRGRGVKEDGWVRV